MRVSVVIATKDRAAYVERALASLATQVGAPPFEVIVVDNGSSDGTRAVVEAAAARATPPVRYLFEPEPNRGKARNRGIEAASGTIVAFCDDDVQVPPGWVAAHAEAHARGDCVANGPILNVASYEVKPRPTVANYSRAFLCTCNVSVPRHALEMVGGFDENFRLYGWEDTELGVRLREAGLTWYFAWDAYIWHIKTETDNTLEVETRKAIERARMARRFLEKHPSQRARMATGAHPANLLRGKYLLPDALLAVYAGLATGEHTPSWLRALARSQFLDGIYTRELIQSLSK
jgi:glycosyltransferase involved in cell wall biosynthesis